MVRSEVRKTFQMIDALPFVRPDDVDMVAFAGYIEYNWLWTSSSDPPSKSLDGTSGMQASAEFLDSPTASWINSSWNIQSQI